MLKWWLSPHFLGNWGLLSCIASGIVATSYACLNLNLHVNWDPTELYLDDQYIRKTKYHSSSSTGTLSSHSSLLLPLLRPTVLLSLPLAPTSTSSPSSLLPTTSSPPTVRLISPSPLVMMALLLSPLAATSTFTRAA